MSKPLPEYFTRFKLPARSKAPKTKDTAPPPAVLPEHVAAGSTVAVAAGEKQAGYRAYGLANGPAKPQRLELRVPGGLAIARPYSRVTEITYDREEFRGIMILFPETGVEIRGRNLKPVVEALLAGTCAFVQQRGEGDQAGRGKPVIEKIIMTGRGKPVIEKIIMTGRGGSAPPQPPKRVVH